MAATRPDAILETGGRGTHNGGAAPLTSNDPLAVSRFDRVLRITKQEGLYAQDHAHHSGDRDCDHC